MSADTRAQSEAALRIRAARVRAAVDGLLARRAAGEPTTDDQWLAQHSDLLPELTEELRKLALIDKARRLSSAIDATLVVLRCPQCRHSMPLDHNQSRLEIQCSQCGARLQVADGPEDAMPARLGRFQLVCRLGAGSFGTVWRAHDKQLDRSVALKVPRHNLADSQEIEEFLREARLAARLKHPHIVAVHEVGHADGCAFIVSDLICGLPLDSWALRHPVSFEQAARLCAEIAEALEHAHQAGVIHRDLKPANILIDERGEPHLTDFGLALRLTGEITVTAEGEILGTPAYMSPEQARGESHRCDARSDVYSLGVILYELLTEELPFRGNSLMQVEQLIHDQPIQPRRLNRFIPRDLETICLKCLEKQPGRRYAGAAALADDLRRFLRGEPTLARPVGIVGQSTRWCRRKPALAAAMILIVALMFLITGGAIWGYLHERAWSVRQQRLWAAISQSSEVQRQRTNVEAAAAALATSPACAELHLGTGVAGYPLLQAWAENQKSHSTRAGDLSVFSWFVLDAQGTQVARGPLLDTIGQNFAWRSYFHGGLHDFARGTRPPAGQHLTRTHISPDFETLRDKRWVVAVSTPLFQGGKFVGVVGMFLELEAHEL